MKLFKLKPSIEHDAMSADSIRYTSGMEKHFETGARKFNSLRIKVVELMHCIEVLRRFNYTTSFGKKVKIIALQR